MARSQISSHTSDSASTQELSRKSMEAMLPFLRKDKHLDKLAALIGYDGVIRNIRGTTRELWYDIFDPSVENETRKRNQDILRNMFEAFSNSDLLKVSTAWYTDSRLNLLAIESPHPSKTPGLESFAKRIPEGNHFVIPIMTGGITMGAAVHHLLKRDGRSLGFALVGYSSGAYRKYIFKDGTAYSAKMHIGDKDLELLRTNSNKPALIVDGCIETGSTIEKVALKLRQIGFKNIKALVVAKRRNNVYSDGVKEILIPLDAE